MSRHSLVLFGEDLPALPLARLEASGAAAALLVDVGAGRIVASNTKGAAMLGLAEGAASASWLDASMPALIRLRRLAARSASTRTAAIAEVLSFWTSRGTVRVTCHVEISHSGGQTLATLIAQPDSGAHAYASMAEPPSLFAGDDAAKLKEIARRIREGQAQGSARRKPRPDPASASDGPTSSEMRELAPTLRANLAHELKTPLSAIAAAAEIMKDQRFGPLGADRYVGYASDIYGSAQHVLGVIERMLAEGRGADPLVLTRDLDFAEIDAGALLEASVSQMAPLAAQAEITLTLDLAPRLPHVVADATSLRQIIFNLLTNALKFTGRGGRVTAGAHYDIDGPLTLVIKDTGPGMSRPEIDRVLRPAAGGPAVKPEAPLLSSRTGLGLGLPIVQALAEANGAELRIESTPGSGTSASIVFRKERIVPV